jgi:hypothetical protein
LVLTVFKFVFNVLKSSVERVAGAGFVEVGVGLVEAGGRVELGVPLVEVGGGRVEAGVGLVFPPV